MLTEQQWEALAARFGLDVQTYKEQVALSEELIAEIIREDSDRMKAISDHANTLRTP